MIITRRKHNLTSLQDNSFGTLADENFKVKVWFNLELENYIHARKFSADQQIEQTKNGLILDFTAKNDYEIVSWILSFGSKVKVLEPDWLVERVRDEISVMRKKY